MVKINGSLQEAAGMTVSEYLKSADFDTRRIVVEKNQMIIPKAEYDQTVL
ncbi:MAG: sulfur carrier protein ThiS [Firmicutes bacterium]|nr:sulfur carrier protein ThiS [Bacillota bacterium]